MRTRAGRTVARASTQSKGKLALRRLLRAAHPRVLRRLLGSRAQAVRLGMHPTQTARTLRRMLAQARLRLRRAAQRQPAARRRSPRARRASCLRRTGRCSWVAASPRWFRPSLWACRCRSTTRQRLFKAMRHCPTRRRHQARVLAMVQDMDLDMGRELLTAVVTVAGMVLHTGLASTRRRTGLRTGLRMGRAMAHHMVLRTDPRMDPRMGQRMGRAMDRVTGRANRVHPVVSRRAGCRCGRCSLRR